MKKRRMAFLLAAGMMLTTVSPCSMTGYAEEVIAEETVELLTADETGTEAAVEVEMEAAEEEPEEIRADEDASEDAEAEIPAEEEPETVGDVPEIPTGEDDFLESVVEVEEALAEEKEYTDTVVGYSFDSAKEIIWENTDTPFADADNRVAQGAAYYYKFTPTETRGYRFYSCLDADNPPSPSNSNTDNTRGILYDSDKKEILKDEDAGNFSIAYELTAGQTYYFKVGFYSNSHHGTIPVKLEKCNWVVSQKRVYEKLVPGSGLTLDASKCLKCYDGTDPTQLTYQWKKDNNTIESASEPTLAINEKGDYVVTVSDKKDSETIKSETITFSVSVDSGLKVISPEDELSMVTGIVGSNITLSVDAVTNAGSLRYVWIDYGNNELGQGSQLTVPVSTARSGYICIINDGYEYEWRRFSVIPSVAGGTLSEGSGSGVTIADAGTFVKLSFVPTETGLYRIHASSNGDNTGGILFDGNNVCLAYNDDEDHEFNGGYYGGDGPDFGIWYKLIAGETYYVTAGYLSEGATGSFTVSADLMGEKCTHSFAEVSRTAATCTTAGSVNYQCTVCTAKKTEVLPATGVHSYGPYTVTAAPTALAEGTQVRTCTVCGAQETAPVAKLVPVVTPIVKLNVTSIPLKVKQSTRAVKVVEMAAGDSVVSWTSSNNKVATVTKTGKITGKKKGTATITVTLASGATAQVKVKVQKNAVKTKKVTVPSKKLTLSVKEKADLGASVTPITSLQKLTYTSSNTKVAAVTKKGVVTAKKKGTAKITIKSGGKKTVVNVTVK